MSDKPKFLVWAHIRSMSNMFLRSFESRPGFGCLSSPILAASMFGEERNFTLYKDSIIVPGFTYKDCIKSVEDFEQKEEHDYIFIKENYYAIHKAEYPKKDLIPKGYRHGFIYRNPNNALLSLQRMCVMDKRELNYELVEATLNYEELYKLYHYVVDNHIDKEPLVINSSFLAESPVEYFKAICKFWNLEYTDAMINMDPEKPTCLNQFPISYLSGDSVWRKDAAKSKSWHKETQYDFVTRSKCISEDVLKFMDRQRMYYDKLNELAICK